jgi:hypothetical protein
MHAPELWTPREAAVLRGLRTPHAVQRFLDGLRYSDDGRYRCPRSVLRDRRAHCFDGALFAAAALRRLGHPPLLVDLRAVRDDDHVIAIFRSHGAFGAVAKSNFVGLRFREPVYRTLRELVMSYFEPYYNTARERTLRSYSGPVSLRPFDRLEWLIRDETMDRIADRLDEARHHAVVSGAQAARLGHVDDRSYRAGMVGVNAAGLYRPGRSA